MNLEEKQTALTAKFIKEFGELEADKEPAIKYYKCGTIFIVEDTRAILAQVEANKYCLISLRNGNRWDNPITLENENNNISFTNINKLAIGEVVPE